MLVKFEYSFLRATSLKPAASIVGLIAVCLKNFVNVCGHLSLS